MNTKSQKIAGFTLIELIITLIVAAILLSIAAPSFVDIIRNNRQITQINDLTASLNLARSEAIKRAVPVTVCNSSNQTSCAGNWQDGWIVFSDLDDDGNFDTGGSDPDIIIRTHGALSNGNTLAFNAAASEVTYDSQGFASRGASSNFTLCDDRGQSSARGLIISRSGRIRVATDTNNDGIVNTGTAGTAGNMVCP